MDQPCPQQISSIAWPFDRGVENAPSFIRTPLTRQNLFGRLKNELFYPRDWKGTTIEQFIEVVDSYIRWYNEKRIKISLGALSPIEYRVSLGLAA